MNLARTSTEVREDTRIGMNPYELWLDDDIEPEELIRLDPLDITEEMVMQAEYPELMDFFVSGLPR